MMDVRTRATLWLVRPALVLVALMVCLVGLDAGPRVAKADTQYFNSFVGQTYRNNFGGACQLQTGPSQSQPCWQGTWASTGLYTGQQVYYIGVYENSSRWQAVYYNPYANFAWVATGIVGPGTGTFAGWYVTSGYYVSTGGATYTANFAHRAWSSHKNWWNGEVGYTSDGYCGQQNLPPSQCP